MENPENSDTGRKVVAAIVGIILIVALVLLAKWAGDKIRGRLTPAKPVVIEQQPQSENLLGDNTKTTATYSAIPKTGPNDWLYAIAGIMLVSGIAVKVSTRRI